MKETFSLILTSYNDTDILSRSLQTILDTLPRWGYDAEIIVVDDGSSSAHRERFKALPQRYPGLITHAFSRNRGRGAAVKAGLRLATCRYVGFIDNDLEIPLYAVLPLLDQLAQGAEVAIARRIYKLSWNNILRYFLTVGYHSMVNRLLGLPGYDTETGCKFFVRETVLPLLEQTTNDRWFWDTEVVYFAHQHGLRIREVPVALDRKEDIPSSVSFPGDIIEYFRNLIALWRAERKKPPRG